MEWLSLKKIRPAIIALAFGWIFSVAAVSAETPQDNVAEVNGTFISKKFYEFELNQVKQRLQQQGQTVSDSQLPQVEKNTLESVINRELLFQESRKQEIQIPPETVADRMSDLKKRFPSEAEYQKALQEINLTESELEARIEKGLAIEKLIDIEIVEKIVISEDEKKSFYDGNPQFFRQPEQIKASHILIKVDSEADDSQKQEAKKKIEMVQRKLESGIDFAELAKEYSEGPSNVSGGDLGYFGRGQMVPAFEDAAFALKPGEISDVVETQFGYHLITVTEKKPERTIGYDEVKEKITQHLQQQRTDQEVQSYIDKLRSTADIKTYLKQ
jgi:peptidyl-prolyl cis-trans isomerase C